MLQGNKKGMAEIFKEEYWRMVYYVRGRIDEAAHMSSEDIVNEVIVRMFERADISRPVENIAAYIYRSLKNSIIDILRGRDTEYLSLDDERSPSLELDSADGHGSPHGLYEKKEISESVYDAVMDLPEDLRSVFIMNQIEGMNFREIAESTGVPQGTLMARKAKALKLLSKQLSHLKIYLED